MKLIDADALIKEWENTFDSELGSKGYMLFIGAVNNMPTIEERKTGRWIEFPSHSAYKCSECGRVIETTDGQNNVYKHYPYCHCGCRMEGERD